MVRGHTPSAAETGKAYGPSVSPHPHPKTEPSLSDCYSLHCPLGYHCSACCKQVTIEQ